MPHRAAIAFLLVGSGACALVYQTAWLRELRLVFGMSTSASAAVLAIFMGGLGFGGWRIGARADRHARPLALYARLELGIAVSAALTPAWVWLAREAYIGLGGATVLGDAGATVARLFLSTLVLGVPTVLMGGTLPAAARAFVTADDRGRRGVGLLYGANTMGSVAGAALATFVLLEALGTARMLWAACAVNALVALAALRLDRHAPPVADDAPLGAVDPLPAATAAVPAAIVLCAAGVVGFDFLLMELVWYRMLAPLLGGSLYTFGLILVVALAGIGLGGAAYALWGRARRPTLGLFALTCALEALFVALPLLAGDTVALATGLIRPLGALGFWGLVGSWAVIVTFAVFPAAFVSGIQFPMLIGLLGDGRGSLGRQAGLAYAANTAGAIAGSLAGGFGCVPLLGAVGTWRMAAIALAVLGFATAALAIVRRLGPRTAAAAIAVATCAVGASLAEGPTAAWRHSAIGAGRIELSGKGVGEVEQFLRDRRRFIAWERDGLESSVALDFRGGYAFVVSGKVDGNAYGDAATQVMLLLVGALVHPDPKDALVVGLGTGSTAGWAAALPSLRRVDVVELEPAILDVARDCSPVNQHALDNPKVHIALNDAREVLLTTPRRYDLIASEPSNPYRAGIASFYTREYYEAVAERLHPGGLFVQWVQAYEIDAQTLRTVYATVAATFPHVETWQTKRRDLLLVAAAHPFRHDLERLRRRAAEPVFRDALRAAWGVDDAIGVLTHVVAGAPFARELAATETELCTDDNSRVEFGFARTVGAGQLDIEGLQALARRRGHHRIAFAGAQPDWSAVDARRLALAVGDRVINPAAATLPPRDRTRLAAHELARTGDWRSALAAWRAEARVPDGITEQLMVAELLADAGDAAAPAAIAAVRPWHDHAAQALDGLWRARRGEAGAGGRDLAQALARFQRDSWIDLALMRRALSAAIEIASTDRELAQTLYATLGTPFVLRLLDAERVAARLALAEQIDFLRLCADALAPWEPHAPWQRELLVARLRCYQPIGHPLAALAADDLRAFLASQPKSLDAGLAPVVPAPPSR